MTFPIQLGRPASAQSDWFLSIFAGLFMIGLSLYSLHPYDPVDLVLVFPLLIGTLILSAFGLFRYTFGEIDETGIRYRRLWGWQIATWSEIASIDLDRKVRTAIVVHLNHGNRWRSRLFFPEIFSQTDEERHGIIRLCRSHLATPVTAENTRTLMEDHV
jgi:hypothetical protein